MEYPLHRHLFRRAPVSAALATLLLVGLMPSFALGAPIPARATLLPVRQFVGDSTGRLLTFRVRNSGTADGIGSVSISRPSAFWTLTACPSAPAGWTRTLITGSCEYTSAPGNGDDIPLNQGRYFKLRATTAASDHNVWGTWAVKVSPDDGLAPIENVGDAAPMGLGLRMKAFTFEVVDAVVSDSTAIIGDPCPAADKTADAGSTGNFVIVCGRNHGSTSLTPTNANSKLLGSMIESHGTFVGGLVPASDDVVTLGYWTDVTVTSHDGAGKALRIRVGAADNRNSPVRRVAGFSAVEVLPPAENVAPVLDASTTVGLADVSEDPGAPVASVTAGTLVSTLVDLTPPLGGLDNVSDPDGPALGIAIVGGSSVGTLWYSIDNGASWTNGGAPSGYSDSIALLLSAGSGGTSGRIYYQPAANVNGAINSVISFRAWDGSTGVAGNSVVIGSTGGSSSFSTATDTASITVNAVNDAPTASNASFSMDENTSKSSVVPGVLADAADIDGDTLQAVVVTSPIHDANFVLNSNGTFTYQPVANYTGPDSFTWQAKDPSGALSSIVTVSITVDAVGGGGGGGGGGGCVIVC